MAKKYRIEIQVDDSDASRKIRDLAKSTQKLDEALKSSAARFASVFRGASQAADDFGARVSKTEKCVKDVGTAAAAAGGKAAKAFRDASSAVIIVNVGLGKMLGELTQVEGRLWRVEAAYTRAFRAGQRGIGSSVAALSQLGGPGPQLQLEGPSRNWKFYRRPASAFGMMRDEEAGTLKMTAQEYQDELRKQSFRDTYSTGSPAHEKRMMAQGESRIGEIKKELASEATEKKRALEELDRWDKEQAAKKAARGRIISSRPFPMAEGMPFAGTWHEPKKVAVDYHDFVASSLKRTANQEQQVARQKEVLAKQHAKLKNEAIDLEDKWMAKFQKSGSAETQRVQMAATGYRRMIDDKIAAGERLDTKEVSGERDKVKQMIAEEDRFQAAFTQKLSKREVSQIVANRRMQNANSQRVKAAIKDAGLEEESHNRWLHSMGMMIARFAVYHMVIGKATELIRGFAKASEDATAANDRLLGQFTDKLAGLNLLSVQMGEMPNEAFLNKIEKINVGAGGPGFDKTKEFLEAFSEGAQQHIGTRITKEQAYDSIAPEALKFAHLHGLESEPTGRFLAQVVGEKDRRQMAPEDAKKDVMKTFGESVGILEQGVGSTKTLMSQMQQFNAMFGKMFKSFQDQAIALSMISQGKPSGEGVFTAARATMQQLIAPNKKLEKFLQGISTDKGKPIWDRSAAEGNGAIDANLDFMSEIRPAINQKIDAMGMTDAQRDVFLTAIGFTAKTGQPGAIGLFGAKSQRTEEEKRAAALQLNVAADIKAREQQPIARLQAEQAGVEQEESAQGGETPDVRTAEQMALGKLRKERRWQTWGDWTRRKMMEMATISFANTDDTAILRSEAQEMLLSKLGAKQMVNPNAGEGQEPLLNKFEYKDALGKRQEYVPFHPAERNFGVNSAAGLQRLMHDAGMASNAANPAANAGLVANPIVAAIQQGNAQVVQAVNALRGQGAPGIAPAPAPLRMGAAPNANGDPGGNWDVLGWLFHPAVQ